MNWDKFNILEITNAISRTCSEWSIDSLTYLGEGDFCSSYVVNNDWVFRFAKHDEARESLKREHCLLPKLTSHISLPIPSPKIASIGNNEQLSFIAYPILPGPPLSQERYLSLNQFDRTACAGQIGHFLNQLHSTDLALVKNCGLKVKDYSLQYSNLLERAQTALFKILDKSDRLFVEGTIKNYLELSDFSNYRNLLLHGDLSPDHVIFDETSRRVFGIIDFGDVMIGDGA